MAVLNREMMGVLKNGLFGGYTGKLGNLVSYQVLNKEVVRIIGKSNKPATRKQLVCRQQMAVVTRFLKPILPFIRAGFELAARTSNMYPQNKALSYNKTQALKGAYPNIEMDYPKVRVTEGELMVAQDPLVSQSGNLLTFSWAGMAPSNWPRSRDQVMMLAYFPDQEMACSILSGARRSEGLDKMEIPDNLSGQRIEVYISFVADDRKSIANSSYLGRLN